MFSFKGRLNRKSFILRTLLLSLIYIFSYAVSFYVIAANQLGTDKSTALMGVIVSLINFVVTILCVIFNFSIIIRRWHDIGKSGWYTLLGFIPPVNFIAGLYLLFKRGDLGNNIYGSPEK